MKRKKISQESLSLRGKIEDNNEPAGFDDWNLVKTKITLLRLRRINGTK